MQHTTSHVTHDDASLFVHQWSPDAGPSAGKAPRAVAHICHGMAEHAARYAHVAQALVDAGFVVYAHDHRGHGHTAPDAASLGTFAESDGWRKAVGDVEHLVRAERQAHPGLPFVLIGHSMGSFMAQQFLQEHGDLLSAAVLSASDGAPDLLATVGRYIARLERWRLGPRGHSSLIQSLSFGAFNKQFKPTRTAFDWLSRDAGTVDAYIADPLCGFAATTGMWVDLLTALGEIAKPAARGRVPKSLPIYVVAGSEDPVGKNTRGLVELIEGYRAAGIADVTHRFYPGGRHEVFNETNRDEVLSDMVRWLREKITSLS